MDRQESKKRKASRDEWRGGREKTMLKNPRENEAEKKGWKVSVSHHVVMR